MGHTAGCTGSGHLHHILLQVWGKWPPATRCRGDMSATPKCASLGWGGPSYAAHVDIVWAFRRASFLCRSSRLSVVVPLK